MLSADILYGAILVGLIAYAFGEALERFIDGPVVTVMLPIVWVLLPSGVAAFIGFAFFGQATGWFWGITALALFGWVYFRALHRSDESRSPAVPPERPPS
jgi:uncharacterized membrane protein YjjB (DUF3815 family)